MLGLITLLASMFCSGVWLFMLFSGNKSGVVLGKTFETYMFFSIGFAVVATVLLRLGI